MLSRYNRLCTRVTHGKIDPSDAARKDVESWLALVNDLTREVEAWAAARHWAVHREEKAVRDRAVMYRKDVILQIAAVEGEWRAAAVAVTQFQIHLKSAEGARPRGSSAFLQPRNCERAWGTEKSSPGKQARSPG